MGKTTQNDNKNTQKLNIIYSNIHLNRKRYFSKCLGWYPAEPSIYFFSERSDFSNRILEVFINCFGSVGDQTIFNWACSPYEADMNISLLIIWVNFLKLHFLSFRRDLGWNNSKKVKLGQIRKKIKITQQ